MESASVAVNNFLYGSKKPAPEEQSAAPTVPSDSAPLTATPSKNAGAKDTTVDEKVAPAVEHETVTEEHEQREKTVIDKERHQDHYHTTIQPLTDKEVLPTQHETEKSATEYREIEHDDDKVKAKVDARQAGFKDTHKEGKTREKHVNEETEVGEQVHHHLHETIQPVIEKEVIQPTVTHKINTVKEKHHEVSHDHGVTKESAISVDDFKRKLEGEPVQKKPGFEGTPDDIKK